MRISFSKCIFGVVIRCKGFDMLPVLPEYEVQMTIRCGTFLTFCWSKTYMPGGASRKITGRRPEIVEIV